METSNNIFENAYFGKLYKTRGERKAIFLRNGFECYYVLIEGGIKGYCVDINGKCVDYVLNDNPNYDIISEWNENN